jgi:hypothetical protein
MKYMLLIYSDPAAAPDPSTPEGQEDFMAWMRVTQELAESGQLVSGDPLQGGETATTVRVRDGEQVLSDGPFAETKELLGGYYLIDVPDLDAATAWAAKMPNAVYGSVEVRPIMEIPGAP